MPENTNLDQILRDATRSTNTAPGFLRSFFRRMVGNAFQDAIGNVLNDSGAGNTPGLSLAQQGQTTRRTGQPSAQSLVTIDGILSSLTQGVQEATNGLPETQRGQQLDDFNTGVAPVVRSFLELAAAAGATGEELRGINLSSIADSFSSVDGNASIDIDKLTGVNSSLFQKLDTLRDGDNPVTVTPTPVMVEPVINMPDPQVDLSRFENLFDSLAGVISSRRDVGERQQSTSKIDQVLSILSSTNNDDQPIVRLPAPNLDAQASISDIISGIPDAISSQTPVANVTVSPVADTVSQQVLADLADMSTAAPIDIPETTDTPVNTVVQNAIQVDVPPVEMPDQSGVFDRLFGLFRTPAPPQQVQATVTVPVGEMVQVDGEQKVIVEVNAEDQTVRLDGDTEFRPVNNIMVPGLDDLRSTLTEATSAADVDLNGIQQALNLQDLTVTVADEAPTAVGGIDTADVADTFLRVASAAGLADEQLRQISAPDLVSAINVEAEMPVVNIEQLAGDNTELRDALLGINAGQPEIQVDVESAKLGEAFDEMLRSLPDMPDVDLSPVVTQFMDTALAAGATAEELRNLSPSELASAINAASETPRNSFDNLLNALGDIGGINQVDVSQGQTALDAQFAELTGVTRDNTEATRGLGTPLQNLRSSLLARAGGAIVQGGGATLRGINNLLPRRLQEASSRFGARVAARVLPRLTGANPLAAARAGAAVGALGVGAIAAAGAFTIVVPAITSAVKGLFSLKDAALATSLKVAGFSGQLASAQAQLDVGRITRDVEFAGNISESGANLIGEQNRLEENLLPIKTIAANLANNVSSNILSGLNTVIETGASVVDAIDAVTSPVIDAIDGASEIILAPIQSVLETLNPIFDQINTIIEFIDWFRGKEEEGEGQQIKRTNLEALQNWPPQKNRVL